MGTATQTQGMTEPVDRLHHIISHQRELSERFITIEKENGHHKDVWNYFPVKDLNDRHAQSFVKDHAFRVVEELCEAVQQLEQEPANRNAILEEMADVYHFLIELCLTVGMNDLTIAYHGDQSVPVDSTGCKLKDLMDSMLWSTNDDYRQAGWEVIKEIGLATNPLKNRPWKQSTRETNIDDVHFHLSCAHNNFLRLCVHLGINHVMLYSAYMGKNAANHNRIEDGV